MGSIKLMKLHPRNNAAAPPIETVGKEEKESREYLNIWEFKREGRIYKNEELTNQIMDTKF